MGLIRKTDDGESFLKRHKKAITVGAGITAVAVLVVLGIRYSDKAVNAFKIAKTCFGKKKINKSPADIFVIVPESTEIAGKITKSSRRSPSSPFPVKLHFRNLPKGQNPSPQKLAEAAEMGIILQPGQTFVVGYMKGLQAA